MSSAARQVPMETVVPGHVLQHATTGHVTRLQASALNVRSLLSYRRRCAETQVQSARDGDVTFDFYDVISACHHRMCCILMLRALWESYVSMH